MFTFNFLLNKSKPKITGENESPVFEFVEVTALQHKAALIMFETEVVSVSMLQRKINCGYELAAKIIESLEELGIVSPFMGSKPREILISKEEYLRRFKVIDEENPQPKQEGPLLPQIKSELQKAEKMEGHEFEYWCADLLRKSGFLDVQVTRGSGDHGVDIVATKDGIRYAIQCKCYSSPLGNSPVQEVNTGKVMYNCHVGVVMTNSSFTSGAIELANKAGVLLWGRDKIEEMIIKAFLDETKNDSN